VGPWTVLSHRGHISESTYVKASNLLTVKGFANGRRDGGSKQVHRHDERPHVFRCFGECILEASDGGKDLGKSDEYVGSALDPYVQRRRDWVAIGVLACGYEFPTRVSLRCSMAKKISQTHNVAPTRNTPCRCSVVQQRPRPWQPNR
jgi:hypothetical protein